MESLAHCAFIISVQHWITMLVGNNIICSQREHIILFHTHTITLGEWIVPKQGKVLLTLFLDT